MCVEKVEVLGKPLRSHLFNGGQRDWPQEDNRHGRGGAATRRGLSKISGSYHLIQGLKSSKKLFMAISLNSCINCLNNHSKYTYGYNCLFFPFHRNHYYTFQINDDSLNKYFSWCASLWVLDIYIAVLKRIGKFEDFMIKMKITWCFTLYNRVRPSKCKRLNL